MAAAVVLLIAVGSAARGADSSAMLEGFTEPYRDLQVGAPDTGVIAQILVDEGQSVRAMQELVRLDDRVLKTSVDVARQAAQMQGEAEAARHQWQAKQRQWEQTEQLHRRGHATDQELWNAENERDQSAARLQAVQEQQQRRVLELRNAEAMLDRSVIRAPIDGVVVGRLKDVGEVVSPADPHLLRVVQLDPLRVTASGPAMQLTAIRPGMVLPVWIGQRRSSATVEYVAPVVDPSSGMSSIQLRLPNPELAVAGGLACRVGLQPLAETKQPAAPVGEDVLRQTLRRFPFLDRATR